MKTRLLFQSLALRSSAKRSTYGGAAAFIAGAGVVSGISSSDAKYYHDRRSNLAMCSSKADNAAASTTTTIVAPVTSRKSIDEPDNTPEHNPLLPFPESSLRHDTYNGVTLDLTTLLSHSEKDIFTTMDVDKFGDMLCKSLDIWAQEKRKGIWLKIPTSHSHLIGPATQLGFDFQHAELGFCVLTKWLPKETASRLPNGPTHQVGVGALVIHPTNGKMLAVQEKSGPAAKRKLWKMPTGLTDPGEDIAVAAVRECE